MALEVEGIAALASCPGLTTAGEVSVGWGHFAHDVAVSRLSCLPL